MVRFCVWQQIEHALILKRKVDLVLGCPRGQGRLYRTRKRTNLRVFAPIFGRRSYAVLVTTAPRPGGDQSTREINPLSSTKGG